MPPEFSKFPMTVKQFLTESDQHLCVGDIVLTRTRAIGSGILRWAMGGEFSHSALVFLTAKPEEGFYNTFILESVAPGVGVANLRDYIGGRYPATEIAVLRLEGEGLDDAYFKRVRGLMLDYIKTGYDYSRLVRLGLTLVFGARLGLAVASGGGNALERAVRKTKSRSRKWVPPQFICSGFIQYGLLKAADLMGRKVDVALKPGMTLAHQDEVLGITPDEISLSHRVTWCFAVRRGWVYRVSSRDEAVDVLNMKGNSQ